jgi:hypothetical protein
VCLLQGGCFVWGSNTNTQMAKGGDDSDNLQPKRIGRTARFRPELQVVQVAFGSQVGLKRRGTRDCCLQTLCMLPE